MSNYQNPEIKRCQRMLIPVNMVTCILCLIAAISLFFTPLIKIDFSKIVNEKTVETIKPIVSEQIKNGVEIPEGDDNLKLDLNDIADKLIDSVMYSIKGSVELSPLMVAEIAFADNPGKIITDKYVNGEDSLLEELIASIEPAMTETLEEVVIDQITANIIDRFAIDQTTAENIDREELNNALQKLGDAQNRDEAEAAVDDYIRKLDEKEELDISEDIKTEARDKILEIYDKAVEETGTEYDLEALICVVVSEAMNMTGGAESDPVTAFSDSGSVGLDTDGEHTDTDGSSGSGEGGSGKIFTSYDEIIKEFTGGNDISTTVKTLLEDMTGNITEQINSNSFILTCVFWGLTAFTLIWLILFLFALFHMFAENKRFTMWYVKLFGGLPCLIFFITPLLLAGPLSGLLGNFISAEMLQMVLPMLGAISSMTWISGICYLALWAVSIFWAFPIKCKIRKLKRADGWYSEEEYYDDEDYYEYDDD